LFFFKAPRETLVKRRNGLEKEETSVWALKRRRLSERNGGSAGERKLLRRKKKGR